ncbi:hypothetical protein HMI55_003995 [Coelomomyces lativittatus]|nr:hypothetical protein HMI56_002023 [Coelomomyces lativittatus]KAJ1515153.1 hypothetical protein HMI55_003995 [Coelomomyces lativittatus]
MPVRHLDILLNERRAFLTESTKSLVGMRLGIDAAYWIKRVLSNLREPTLAAFGSCHPFGLKDEIEKEIRWFREHRIQPFFVFPGLNVRKDHKPLTVEDTRPNKRNSAWEAYAKGQINSATAQWASAAPHLSEVFPFVMRWFHEWHVEFMRAPYSSWGQLVYLLHTPNQSIHAIYAGTDVLIFDVDRIITQLDYEKETFLWVDKLVLLNQLSLTKDQFLDCCILAGFDWISTYGPLTSDPVMPFNWTSLLELMRQYRSGYLVAQSFPDYNNNKARYLDLFCKTKCAVKHHLVMTFQGLVEPLEKSYAPSDLQDVFGPKLPDSYYYLLTQGVYSTGLLNSLLSKMILEYPPLCNGETSEFQSLLSSLVSLRLLPFTLYLKDVPSFKRGGFSLCYWYAPTTELPAKLPLYPDLKWSITEPLLQNEIQRQGNSNLDFVFCLQACSNSPSKTIGHGCKHMKKDQIIVDILFKLLELRGFVDAQHVPTALGQSYLTAITKKPKFSSFPVELFVVCELVKLGLVHGHPLSRVYHDDELEEPVKTHICLLSRIACFLEPSQMTSPWQGPLNRDLLTYSSMIKFMARVLHSVTEALPTTLSMHVSQIDYQLETQSPFFTNKTCLMGIWVYHYLISLLPSSTTTTSSTPSFSSTTSTLPPHELLRYQTFLELVITFFQAANDPLLSQYEATYQWFQQLIASNKSASKKLVNAKKSKSTKSNASTASNEVGTAVA